MQPQPHDRLIARLRSLLPEYLAQKGILVRGKKPKPFRCLNPQHEDRHPSMSYYPPAERVKCFSCGVSYDLFSLIALDYPACDSFPRQVKKACDIFGLPFPDDFGRGGAGVSTSTHAAPQALREAAAAAAAPGASAVAQAEEQTTPPPDYTAFVAEKAAKSGDVSYFTGRGISARLCEAYRLFQADGRAYLPLYEGDRCTAYCARAIDDRTQPRYKNSVGTMGIFGADYFTGEGKGGTLFVTESIFDALSVIECGFQAVALCGAANVGKLLALCRENPTAANSYRFLAAGDADAAGARMNTALCDGLHALECTCGTLTMPDGVNDLNELLQRDRTALQTLLYQAVDADRAKYRATSAAAALDELIDTAMKHATRQTAATGFPKLDDLLDGGLHPGLYIIGAISSLGKTSYVLQIADHLTESGTDVLYFSLEMSRIELMAKSISRLTFRFDPTADHMDAFTARQVMQFAATLNHQPTEAQSVRRAQLLQQAFTHYRKGAEGLYIREGIGDISATDIREAVRAHIRMRGRRPVVLIDYLQILKPTDPRATDKQNTDRSVVELKRISRDFDLPVLAISSFNRENYRNAVSMEAFKESGAVEYSSDVLLGLQLSGAGESGFDVNAAKGRSPRAVELVMLKNRSGVPYAKIEYAYRARFNLFGEGARTV